MSFEGELKEHLQGGSAIQNIVGTGIFPLIVPEGQSMPAVTYTEILGDPVANLDGIDASLRGYRMSIDTWAMSQSEAAALRLAVRDRLALDATNFRTDILPGGGQDYEPDTKRYRAALECICWFRET